MSVERETRERFVLTCDHVGCRQTFSGDWGETRRRIMTFAAGRGWSMPAWCDPRTYCPQHKPQHPRMPAANRSSYDHPEIHGG